MGRLRRVRLLGVVLTLGAWWVFPTSGAQTARVTRGPYLQRGAATSIVARWRTDIPTDSRVVYGPAPDSLLWVAAAAELTTEHEVLVPDLVGGTTYFYGVGTTREILAGGDADHFFVTPPAAGTGRPTRVWVTADAGAADANAAAVGDAYRRFAAARYTDMWLTLGGIAQPAGTDREHRRALFETYPDLLRQTVLWPTLGAADARTANVLDQTGPYFDIFTVPTQGEAGGVPSDTEAYYAFDHGDIHVIALDSIGVDRASRAPMLAWLQADLTQNIKPWVMAFWHHPPYSKGAHDSDTEPALVEMRATVLPILEAGGVDLVLSGDSRSYERSVLLDGHYGPSATLRAAMTKDPGDGRPSGTGAYQKPSPGPAQHEGAVYVVLGGSAQRGAGPLDHPAMVTAAETPGSLVLDIAGHRLEATFLDGTGVVRDAFTLQKGRPAAADVVPTSATVVADAPAVAPLAAPVQTPDHVGAWGPVMDWNLQAKHMILLPTGNVLVWSTGDNASVWNVTTDSSFTPVPYFPGDLHCAAQATMADGRIVVLGGQGASTHQGTQVTAFV